MTEQTGGEKSATPTMADELAKLGKKLGEALQAAWESEERQELQNELRDGLDALGSQLEEAVQSARKSEAFSELKADLRNAAGNARQAMPLEDIRDGLVKGLQKLNTELSRLIESWQAGRDAGSGAADDSSGKSA